VTQPSAIKLFPKPLDEKIKAT